MIGSDRHVPLHSWAVESCIVYALHFWPGMPGMGLHAFVEYIAT